MHKAIAAFASIILLAGCSSTAAEPTATPSETTSSPAPTSDATQASTELNAVIENSLRIAEATGFSSMYSDDSTPFFLEIYDPQSSYDYRGVGWTIESNEVELLLDLNMFSLYRLQAAFYSAEPTEIKKIDTYTYEFAPTDAMFGELVTVTMDDQGRVTTIDFPADQRPDNVVLQYQIDPFMQAMVQRANDEFLGNN